MMAVCQASSAGCQKQCSENGHFLGDRISQLPEDIRLLILSFLTLKESARTSVLSTQWKTLWIHVPNPKLNFKDIDIIDKITKIRKRRLFKRERHKYLNLVDTVLHKTGRSTLDEFKVWFNLAEPSRERIDAWLEHVFARGVKSLELNFSVGVQNAWSNPYMFPEQLLLRSSYVGKPYSQSSLTHQNAPINFNSLKELKLKAIGVTSEAIQLILLKFPFLERLVVAGNTKMDKLVVSDPSLKLKYLELKCCSMFDLLIICDSKLVSLRITLVRELIVTNAPMLAEVEVDTRPPGFPLYVFSQLSSCLSHLEVLMLIAADVNMAQFVERMEHNGLPELSNIKQLVMRVEISNDGSFVGITSFLKACPNLKKFVLLLEWSHLLKIDGQTAKAAKCFLKHLEVVELSGYYGRISEVELIMFFLENSDKLEKIIVDPRDQFPERKYNFDDVEAARTRAKQQLAGGLVPAHINLVIL